MSAQSDCTTAHAIHPAQATAAISKPIATKSNLAQQPPTARRLARFFRRRSAISRRAFASSSSLSMRSCNPGTVARSIFRGTCTASADIAARTKKSNRAHQELVELGPEPPGTKEQALWREERRGALVLLAALAEYDASLLRRATLGTLDAPVEDDALALLLDAAQHEQGPSMP